VKALDRLDSCKIPTWSLSAIFNSDYSGLFGNDVMFLETYLAWLEKLKREIGASSYVIALENDTPEEYFDDNPEFGLPCNVVDRVVIFIE